MAPLVMFNVEDTVALAPTNNDFAIPIPPEVDMQPVVAEIESVVDWIVIPPATVNPLPTFNDFEIPTPPRT